MIPSSSDREVDDTACKSDIERDGRKYERFDDLYKGFKARLPNGLSDIKKASHKIQSDTREGGCYYLYKLSGALNPNEDEDPEPGPDIRISYSYDSRKIRILCVKAVDSS